MKKSASSVVKEKMRIRDLGPKTISKNLLSFIMWGVILTAILYFVQRSMNRPNDWLNFIPVYISGCGTAEAVVCDLRNSSKLIIAAAATIVGIILAVVFATLAA